MLLNIEYIMSYQTNSHYETDEEMVTCENCGNCWDGFAQCSCNGIPIDEPAMDNNRRTHTMTLRSHTEKLRVEKKREKVKAKEHTQSCSKEEGFQPKAYTKWQLAFLFWSREYNPTTTSTTKHKGEPSTSPVITTTTPKVKLNDSHPNCWNENSHYGQCGQSCPCCRAMVGDEWGACLICSKNH